MAIALKFENFEDAVQYACAIANQAEVIVTRDLSGFAKSKIPVVLPKDFSL